MFSFRVPLPFFGDQSAGSDVHLEPVTKERLGPAEFLARLEESPERIESSSFVAPSLGDEHFGYFEVEYSNPIYK